MLFPNILINPIISKIQIFVTLHFGTLCPVNYSVSLPESVGMRSHLMGVVKPVAQGWGYSKGTLAHYPLNHYDKQRDNSYFLATLAHSFTSNQLCTQREVLRVTYF